MLHKLRLLLNPVLSKTHDLSIHITTDDIEGDEVVFEFTMQDGSASPSWLSIVNYNSVEGIASIIGIPSNDDVGDYPLLLKAIDKTTLKSTQQLFGLTVADINDPPVITSTVVTTAVEDEIYSYSINAQDPDNDNISFTATLTDGTPLPDWLLLTTTNDSQGIAELTGIPSNNNVGTFPIEIRASDPQDPSLFDSQQFILRVLNVNDAPVISGVPKTNAIEGRFYLDSLAFTDPDNTSFELLTEPENPEWLSISISESNYIFFSGTPEANDIGINNFSVILSDTDANTKADTLSFNIDVLGLQDAPIFSSIPVEQAIIGQRYLYQIELFLPSDGEIDFSITLNSGDPLPEWLQVIPTSNPLLYRLTGIPFGDSDEARITLKATATLLADNPLSSSQVFEVLITHENSAPVFTSTPVQQVNEKDLYLYNITTFDAEENNVFVTATLQDGSALPEWLRLVNVNPGNRTATLRGTPGNDDVGFLAIQITITDDAENPKSSSQLYYLDINNVNDLPIFVSDPAEEINQLDLYEYLVVIRDPDNDPVTITASRTGQTILPEWLTFLQLSDSSAILTGIPQAEDIGLESITIVADDGNELSLKSGQSFFINVLDVNEAPQITSSPIPTAIANTLYEYSVSTPIRKETELPYLLLVDGSADYPEWIAINQVDADSYSLVANPSEEHTGSYQISLIVSDDGAPSESSSQVFTLNVVGQADAPALSVSPNQSLMLTPGMNTRL